MAAMGLDFGALNFVQRHSVSRHRKKARWVMTHSYIPEKKYPLWALKYVSDSVASEELKKLVENLEALGLCECIKDLERSKRLRFNAEGLALWEKAKPFMASPVKAVKYCDAVPVAGFQYSGISALASYTMISPDENPTVAVYSGEFKDGSFRGLNDFDGDVKIEIWRYPALDVESDAVDRLSLFLSLEDNEDPRVEKENKSMFDKIWQKM